MSVFFKFSDEYLPKAEDIKPEDIDSARAAVTALHDPVFPDLDKSPGTVVGDSIIAPASLTVAALDEAVRRLLSDMNTGNVAEGVIYSCDFVREYLGNFGVYDATNRRGTGVVRLVFTSPSEVRLPRHMMLRNGNCTLNLRFTTTASEMTILAAGSLPATQADTYRLVQTSDSLWVVDVPLEGDIEDDNTIARGAKFTVSYLPDNLVDAVAAVNFSSGTLTASLPELAKLARLSAAAVGATTKAGTVASTLRYWPSTVQVSPVATGDKELTRTNVVGPIALAAPAMDVYYRSSYDLTNETQTVMLKKSGNFFRGEVNFLHRPSKITQVKWAGASDLPADSRVAEYTLVSYVPAASAPSDGIGTRAERFFIQIEAATVSDVPNLTIQTEYYPDGTVAYQYANFTIGYLCDPLFEIVAAEMEDSARCIPGVSVLVRQGPLIDYNIEVNYVKQQGVRVLANAAATRISSAYKKSGYPEVFSEAVVHDIMTKAGADRVTAVLHTGKCTVTPSTRYTNTLPTLSSSYKTIGTPIAPHTVTSAHPTVAKPWVGNSLDNYATENTVRRMVDVTNITFKEVLR